MKNLRKILILMMVSIIAMGLVGCDGVSKEANIYIKNLKPVLKEYTNKDILVEKEAAKEEVLEKINEVYLDYNEDKISIETAKEVLGTLTDYNELKEDIDKYKEIIDEEEIIRKDLLSGKIYTHSVGGRSDENLKLEFKDVKSVIYGKNTLSYLLRGNKIEIKNGSDSQVLYYKKGLLLMENDYVNTLFAKDFDLDSYVDAQVKYIKEYTSGNFNARAPKASDYFDSNVMGVNLNDSDTLKGYGAGWSAYGYYGEYYFDDTNFVHYAKKEDSTFDGTYTYDKFTVLLNRKDGSVGELKVLENKLYSEWFTPEN